MLFHQVIHKVTYLDNQLIKSVVRQQSRLYDDVRLGFKKLIGSYELNSFCRCLISYKSFLRFSFSMMSRMYQTNLGGFDINKQELEQKQKQEQEVAQEWW